MKKKMLCASALMVGLVLATSGTFAAVSDNKGFGTGAEGNRGGGAQQVAKRDQAEPFQPFMPGHNTDITIAGPMSLSSDGMTISQGSALVAPRGGSFMTSRQRADRAIRATIRKLD